MSYPDERLNQIQAEVNHLNNLKRQLREREKSIKARELYLRDPSQFQYNNVKSLRQNLQGSLAPHMVPANVGGINEICWPFYFQAQVDFGADPDIASNIIKKTFFQVDQEACFILMSITVGYNTDAADLSACQFAPLSADFIDRQSSRRFNTGPVPIQTLGNNSNPAVLPTGMLLMPNAFLDVSVYGMNEVAQSFTGNGEVNFSFFGYRTRTENAGKVLSTIFG